MNKGQASPSIAPTYKIYFFLILGLSTAVSFRALIIIDRLQPDWVRPLWYFAVLGNFLFFCYRYLISKKRKETIQHFELIDKINNEEQLKPEDRRALNYILQSIKQSPENINYLIISIFSLVAIAIDQLIVNLADF